MAPKVAVMILPKYLYSDVMWTMLLPVVLKAMVRELGCEEVVFVVVGVVEVNCVECVVLVLDVWAVGMEVVFVSGRLAVAVVFVSGRQAVAVVLTCDESVADSFLRCCQMPGASFP
eukprot:926505-Amphidinium_carterae.1